MANKLIFIDPGHGGSDPGACHGTRHEADDNLMLSLLIKDELERQEGVEAVLARETDVYVTHAARTNAANKLGADYFLSIHRNSYGANSTGNEIWVLRTATQNTQLKARAVLDAVCGVDGLTDRGVKLGAPAYTNFAVNRDSKMPSALLEISFISNSGDNAVYDRCINGYAKSIAKALCEIVGVAYAEAGEDASEESNAQNGGESISFTTGDARKALRIACGITDATGAEFKMFDIDGDGVVSIRDARAILRKSVGIE